MLIYGEKTLPSVFFLYDTWYCERFCPLYCERGILRGLPTREYDYREQQAQPVYIHTAILD